MAQISTSEVSQQVSPDMKDIIASVSRALLGMVSIHLRQVAFKLDGNKLCLRFDFDRAPTDEDRELGWAVGGEVACDFYDIYPEESFHFDPRRFPGLTGWMQVFRRQEDGEPGSFRYPVSVEGP